MVHLSLRDKLTHFCWAWAGTAVNRELGDNYHFEEVQNGWKEARYNGLCGVEAYLLRMIEGKDW
jgi:hypothetical protein